MAHLYLPPSQPEPVFRTVARLFSWLVFFVAIAWLMGPPRAKGEEKPPTPAELKARFEVALSLAKAKRERETKEAVVAASCFRDLALAQTEAEKSKKKLVLWVGMKCEDYPTLRAELSDCVHCHVARYNDDETPRLVITANDGKQYRVERPDLTVGAVKHALGESR